MKKAVPFLLAFVIAVAGLAAFTCREPEDALVLAGTVEARDVRVGSLVGGRVLAVHADEGDRVAAGSPLVTLEPDLPALEVAQQEAALAEAEARRDAVLAGPRVEDVTAARLTWQEADRERRRLQALHDEGVVSRSALDRQATEAATAREELLRLQRGSREEDVAAAEAAVRRESGRLQFLKRRQAETIVTAPVAARVQAIDLRPGDVVAASQPVAELVEDGRTWVRLYVPETKLGLVSVGQEVALRVDSFPGRDFRGRVASIRDRAEYTPRNVQTLDQRSDQVFGIRVEIDEAPELKPGMAVTARLLAAGASP